MPGINELFDGLQPSLIIGGYYFLPRCAYNGIGVCRGGFLAATGMTVCLLKSIFFWELNSAPSAL